MKIIELEKNDEIYITNKDRSRFFHIKCVKNKLTYEEVENFKAEENTIIKNINFDELTMFQMILKEEKFLLNWRILHLIIYMVKIMETLYLKLKVSNIKQYFNSILMQKLKKRRKLMKN